MPNHINDKFPNRGNYAKIHQILNHSILSPLKPVANTKPPPPQPQDGGITDCMEKGLVSMVAGGKLNTKELSAKPHSNSQPMGKWPNLNHHATSPRSKHPTPKIGPSVRKLKAAARALHNGGKSTRIQIPGLLKINLENQISREYSNRINPMQNDGRGILGTIHELRVLPHSNDQERTN
ncbi:hypothetical protein LIER_23655 [Lithospermum erythrorhizon]|uniref:Uncharacterized protein n=1 Tax=Lithospermum erythrorhizon TaxID=34254 RepID=A0AAV3QYA2_LITER